MRIAVALLSVFLSTSVLAEPCTGLDRTLTAERKITVASALAAQLKSSKVDILNVFGNGNWTILYVNTHISDETFFFYPDDPAKTGYVTMWSGAAALDEGPVLRQWALENARGLPPALAECFAWFATKGRQEASDSQ
jgi:hypothetical protein